MTAKEIVLVHGAWHGPWCWDQVAAALRDDGFTVSTPALPGHDAPGSRSRTWNTIASYVDAVGAAVEACATPPILVGHSMGGYCVQRYLETQVAPAAILVASVPRRGALAANLRAVREYPGPALTSTVLGDYSRLVGSPELVRALFFTEHTDQAVVDAAYAQLQNESAFAIMTMLFRLPRPAGISTPVHVVGATDDHLFTVAEQRDLAKAYGVEPTFLESGHDLMLDSSWPELAAHIAMIARSS